MRYVPLIVLILGSLCILWLLCSGPAPGAPAAAHAAVLASIEATACPAPEKLVTLARKNYRSARATYSEWLRARRCLGLDGRHMQLTKPPRRDAPADRWLAFIETVQREHRVVRAKLKRCVWLMRHPGGTSCGTRWIPLAKWIGWPKYALRNLAALMMNESSGRPRAVSPTNDHGLVQFNLPSWSRTWARVMKCPFIPGVYDPELNLRFALYVFRLQGDSFLPAWRGDPAATF